MNTVVVDVSDCSPLGYPLGSYVRMNQHLGEFLEKRYTKNCRVRILPLLMEEDYTGTYFNFTWIL
jgi:hypothetical protein